MTYNVYMSVKKKVSEKQGYQLKAWATKVEKREIDKIAKKLGKSTSRHLIDSALNHENL